MAIPRRRRPTRRSRDKKVLAHVSLSILLLPVSKSTQKYFPHIRHTHRAHTHPPASSMVAPGATPAAPSTTSNPPSTPSSRPHHQATSPTQPPASPASPRSTTASRPIHNSHRISPTPRPGPHAPPRTRTTWSMCVPACDSCKSASGLGVTMSFAGTLRADS